MPNNECKKCGRCCIVIPEVRLTREESYSDIYLSRNIPNKKQHILMRKMFYCQELNKIVFCCIYLDVEKMLCGIYEDRPKVCRIYNCMDKRYTTQVHKIWKEMKEGMQANCLRK